MQTLSWDGYNRFVSNFAIALIKQDIPFFIYPVKGEDSTKNSLIWHWKVCLSVFSWMKGSQVLSVQTISHSTPPCFRPQPPSVLPAPPGPPTEAPLCSHVAAGEAERCGELREASGVRVDGDGGRPWADQPQTESPARPGSESQGEQKSLYRTALYNLSFLIIWRVKDLLIFQLILELCKGSARGFVDSQAIQSHLDRLPITAADSDVSTAKE